jgi:hypothetical protein
VFQRQHYLTEIFYMYFLLENGLAHAGMDWRADVCGMPLNAAGSLLACWANIVPAPEWLAF